ncbi:hypothetical protein F2P81_022660 [Scophthalmus maximus]|uniref:Secreted protein n=1 Tax=Scophthalmus maximus TaxID=52904 RepID=A0A6A4RZT0_SCOMX|nr:hypothetical protein F2P81_022660 [Scophthalmus maximus]
MQISAALLLINFDCTVAVLFRDNKFDFEQIERKHLKDNTQLRVCRAPRLYGSSRRIGSKSGFFKLKLPILMSSTKQILQQKYLQ